MALHSQNDPVHAEPISITQDPLVSLTSPPKSQIRDNSNSPQKETFRTAVRNSPAPSTTGTTAPTILKRAQSVLSASASASTGFTPNSASFGLANANNSAIACASATGPAGTTASRSSQSGLSTNTTSGSRRRSRVVFSRTVLVGNGSETIQLNCPSETDDEEDRRRQVLQPAGSFSVDDLVINRTTQPWIHARKSNGLSTKDLVYATRSSKPRTRTVGGRKLYRPVNNDQLASSYRNYPERLTSTTATTVATAAAANSLPVPVIKPTSPASHPGQQHHHNCQAARQAMKIVPSGADFSKRDTM